MSRIAFGVSALFLVAALPAAAASHSHDHGAGQGHGGAHAHGHWTAPATAQTTVNPVPATADSLRTGAALFQQNCATCHGPSGRGDGELAGDLETAPADLMTMAPTHTDGDFAWKIANGRGEMPPWEGALSEEEIWHVVNFLKDLPAQMHGAPADQPEGHGGHSHAPGGGHGS